MSEENKSVSSDITGSETDAANGPAEDVSSFFESLITEDEEKTEKTVVMKDFSEFFNDAAASGHGFESTIDKDSLPEPDEEGETLQFGAVSEKNEASDGEQSEDTNSPEEEKKAIITEPVTDENGMIVLYDEEAGIDAISEIMSDASEKFDESKKEAEKSEEGGKPCEDAAQTDEKIDNPAPESETGHAVDTVKTETEEEPKRPFIQTLIPWKGDSIAEIIRKIIFIASTTVFVAAGIMLISTLVQSQEALQEQQEIKDIVTTTVATTVNEQGETVTIPPTEEERVEHNIDMMEYFGSISKNVIAYLEISACDIFYPVVQAGDNSYYLTHTFDDRSNKAGAIFMDFRCTITEDYRSPNIVLYGHNQEDGTMFGNLKRYKNNIDFYRENPFVVFNTKNDIGDYVIYAYFVTNVLESQDSNGEVFHYQDYIETMSDENTFNWYMNEVAERNQIITPVDVTFGDQLLVLSTCSNEFTNSRFVVFARKLREGETKESFDFSTARYNPYAKQIDWTAVMSESTDSSVTEETTVPETVTEETTAAPETSAPEETAVTNDTAAESETEETTESTEETSETEETTTTTITTPPQAAARPLH
ncbi:MAG: sortase domain-bontaining protein [Huintestinicola sp.]